MRKEEKWTNKRNNKQEDAVFLLHNKSQTKCLYELSNCRSYSS